MIKFFSKSHILFFLSGLLFLGECRAQLSEPVARFRQKYGREIDSYSNLVGGTTAKWRVSSYYDELIITAVWESSDVDIKKDRCTKVYVVKTNGPIDERLVDILLHANSYKGSWEKDESEYPSNYTDTHPTWTRTDGASAALSKNEMTFRCR